MPTRLLLLALALAPGLGLAQDAPPPEAAAPAPAAAPEPPAAAAPPPVAAPAAEATTAPAATPPPAPAGEAAPVIAPAAALQGAELLPPPPAPPPAVAPFPRFGVSLGIGVPNAATLALMYRPFPWIRFSLGPSWNYVGWGINGGVVLSPIRWAISPTFGVEGGRFFGADLNRFIKDVDPGIQPLLRDVTLQYVAGTLGLELGSQRGFAFALRAGLTYLQVDAPGTAQLTGTAGTAGANDAVVTVTSPSFRGTAPTVQLVFQYFI